MVKPKDTNAELLQEDADNAIQRRRSEAHQEALAAEDKEQRTERARLATEGPDDLVPVTVTKFGEGKVSTGAHVATVGDVYAKKGDVLLVSPHIAEMLEKRGFAET